MRFAHLLVNGRRQLAVRRDDVYVLLGAIDETLPSEMGALLRAAIDVRALAAAIAKAPAQALIAVHEATYAPMLAEGAKILCLGLNYLDHAAETSFARPDYPVVFSRYASSFVGHGHPLMLPVVSKRFDYEAELAVMIGRGGRHISKEKALEHVGGYTLVNDGTVRDYQVHTAQWTMGKNFDRSGAVGPELVTADELPLGAAGLSIQGRLNEAIMQNANTSTMIFDVATTIAYLSQAMELAPGDLISMGTPAGVGNARSPQVFLAAGDTFEVQVERIGSLRNSVRPEME